MGKLLQKIVHGIAPSWLTKVNKSSAGSSSPKKLLPFFRGGGGGGGGGNKTSSNKSSPSSLSTPPSCLAADKSSHQEDENSSITTMSPRSPSMQRKESESEKGDSIHPHEEPQYLHSEDVKEYSHRSFQHLLLEEDNISSQPQSDPHRNYNLAAELYARASEEMVKELQHDLQGDTHHSHDRLKELQPMQLGDTHHSHGRLKELQPMQLGDTHHSQDSGREGQYDSGYDENAYQEMLGAKRKSRSLQSDDGGGDDDDEGGSGGSGDVKQWVWKRRKGEKGLMSCELPETICSIVGNGRAVVKRSLEPDLVLWESMVEMIVGNGLWELGNLEFLLYCYLSLNEPHLHPIIQSCFLQVLKDLERIS